MIHSWSQVPRDDWLGRAGEAGAGVAATRVQEEGEGRVGERPARREVGKEGRKIEEEVEDIRGEGGATVGFVGV